MAILAKLMGMEQRKTYEKFKENLTMEENPIRIILEKTYKSNAKIKFKNKIIKQDTNNPKIRFQNV